MALAYKLKGLSTREAIIDSVYRCIQGLDLPDKDLFISSATPDAVFDIRGTRHEGRDAILTTVFDHVATLDTTHFITNLRVDIKDGEKEAAATANALSYHFRLGEGVQPGTDSFIGGALYEFQFVKDESDGLWKWKFWKAKLVWTEGNVDVVTPGK